MAVVPLRVMRTAVVAWAEIDVPRPFVPVVSVVSVVVGSFVAAGALLVLHGPVLLGAVAVIIA